MAINDILEIGRQSLTAQRQALQTTSNNIANANTPGYSRQRPVFQSHEQSLSNGIRIGGGVEVKQVVRSHDIFVHNQIIDESRGFGAAKAKHEGLRKLEGVVANEGFRIGDLVSKFFNDVRDLSANPETPALRSTVASAAETAAAGFRNLNGSLQTMKQDIDSNLSFSIEEINSSTRELASLNEKISHFEITGESPNELYDRRDQIQRDLSQRLGFQTSTDDRGNVNISAGGLGIIVQGNQANTLEVHRTPAKGEKGPGSLDIFIKEPGGPRMVTTAFKDGEIGGLLHVRDQVINPALANLDKAAFEFAGAVNAVHKEGQGSDGLSGRGMFKDLTEVNDASHLLDISAEVKAGHHAIATGYSADSVGDNRVALKIASLQEEKLLPMTLAAGEALEGNRTQTLNESLNSMVGKIAVATASEEQNFKHQEAVMSQLENYRQSITGVSLEEEAINMMQFQAVFNASAKCMKVGDELFQTVLSLKP